MQGRTPGELVTGTLEVDDYVGRLVAITHTGSAPLPEGGLAALAAAPLKIGDDVPDAALIDQSNRRRSLSEWHGASAVVTFIYTRCPLPNFCPLMDQNFRTLQGELADDPQLRGRVKLISISFDPEHDTPEVLAEHARKVKADTSVWTFLTGDRVTIDRVSGRLGVRAFRSPEDASQITHNLSTAIIDADGRLAHLYEGNDWTPSTVLKDLRAAVRTP
jgi:protein SCO1/2